MGSVQSLVGAAAAEPTATAPPPFAQSFSGLFRAVMPYVFSICLMSLQTRARDFAFLELRILTSLPTRGMAFTK